MTVIGWTVTTLCVVGFLATAVGAGAFEDKRKPDRRYKTGYKGNAPDPTDPALGRNALCIAAACFLAAYLVYHFSAVTSMNAEGSTKSQTFVTEAALPRSASLRPKEQVDVVVTDAQIATARGDDTSESRGTDNHESIGKQRTASGDQLGTASPNSGQNNGGSVLKTAELGHCGNSQTWLERRVCEDASLYALDQQLAVAVKDALQRVQAPQFIEIEQSNWRSKVLVTCYDELCLRDAMTARIAELTGRYRN